MEAAPLPQISSFIIRFVMDETSAHLKAYHGTIRHIQTAEEISGEDLDDLFADLADCPRAYVAAVV